MSRDWVLDRMSKQCAYKKGADCDGTNCNCGCHQEDLLTAAAVLEYHDPEWLRVWNTKSPNGPEPLTNDKRLSDEI